MLAVAVVASRHPSQRQKGLQVEGSRKNDKLLRSYERAFWDSRQVALPLEASRLVASDTQTSDVC